MSWEAGEEAEDGFVGAPGVVSHQIASQPESPVLRFLPVGLLCKLNERPCGEQLAPGTWHIAGPARGLVNVSTPPPCAPPTVGHGREAWFPSFGAPLLLGTCISSLWLL